MSADKQSLHGSDIIDTISDLLHQLTWNIRLDELGTWSDMLKGMLQRDLHILGLIAEKPDIILKEILDELHIPSSTLTSAINRMERRGLLKRIISQRDRRSYGLELTTKGAAIYQEHKRIDRMIAQKVFDALQDEQETQTLITLLEKISHTFANNEHEQNRE